MLKIINRFFIYIFSFVAIVHNVIGKDSKIKKNKPNIFFILPDDLGYLDVGVFHQNERKERKKANKPWISTPKLDALAKTGVTLTQHYCAAPVSSPSRASLLMGVSQGHSNVRNNQFDKALEDNYTIASVLKEAGYTTAAFGK